LQTLIYKVAIEELLGREVTGVIWNYIRTAQPQPPRLLANGSLSMAQHQTTTIDLYRRSIKQHGLDPKQYAPFLRRLEARERLLLFPRHLLPLVQAEDVLLRDYITSVKAINAAQSDPTYVPVRTLAPHCDWCGFVKLCTAAVAGGDTRELMKRYYNREDEKEKEHG
jgi:hypothetical protein